MRDQLSVKKAGQKNLLICEHLSDVVTMRMNCYLMMKPLKNDCGSHYAYSLGGPSVNWRSLYQ